MRPLPDSHPVRCCGSAGIYNLTHTPMALTTSSGTTYAATSAILRSSRLSAIGVCVRL